MYGSITPSQGLPGATSSATARGSAACAAGRSAAAATAAASRSAGPTSHERRGAPSVRHHDGERLLVAVLAAPQFGDGRRVARVAGQVIAAEPLRAPPIRPSRSAAAKSASGSSRRDAARPSASRSRRRGPQAGQAVGWAWKRRSAGSSYSARQRRTWRTPAIVVRARSYGAPVMIVSRGPQLVQLRNGIAETGGRPGRTAPPGSPRRWRRRAR